MSDEKILEKLSKIKMHMESAKEIGSEAEAQAFATMTQELPWPESTKKLWPLGST